MAIFLIRHAQTQALIARLPTINHIIVSRFTHTQQTAHPSSLAKIDFLYNRYPLLNDLDLMPK